MLHDAKTGECWVPLQTLPQAKASFAVYNSPLSENAAVGFEYGYTVHAPAALVLWEAQFGDFANGAQVIIDQFLAAARAKWQQEPALVLLLPHGYEGQGPEHSSARLERFLQIFAEGNLLVANPTTAAQYFHLLRRQAKSLAADRRPLIVMTPKSLLRNPLAASSLDQLAAGEFQAVLDDPRRAETPETVTRLVLCSGKLAVELDSAPQREEAADVAIVRVERLAPFPDEEIARVLARYQNLTEVVWAQEEPRNMGAWTYVEPRLRELLTCRRKEIASSVCCRCATLVVPSVPLPPRDRSTGTESSRRASSRPRWWKPRQLRWRRTAVAGVKRRTGRPATALGRVVNPVKASQREKRPIAGTR